MLNKILNAIKDTHPVLLTYLARGRLNSPSVLMFGIAISLA